MKSHYAVLAFAMCTFSFLLSMEIFVSQKQRLLEEQYKDASEKKDIQLTVFNSSRKDEVKKPFLRMMSSKADYREVVYRAADHLFYTNCSYDNLLALITVMNQVRRINDIGEDDMG